MILDEAEKLALAYINKIGKIRDEIIITDRYKVNDTSSWVFFYDSRRWIENREISYALAGNAPIIVTDEGRIIQLSTLNWELELANYK